jgi:hypothetical protein
VRRRSAMEACAALRRCGVGRANGVHPAAPGPPCSNPRKTGERPREASEANAREPLTRRVSRSVLVAAFGSLVRRTVLPRSGVRRRSAAADHRSAALPLVPPSTSKGESHGFSQPYSACAKLRPEGRHPRRPGIRAHAARDGCSRVLDELRRRRCLLDERLCAEGVVDQRSRSRSHRLVDERPRAEGIVDQPRGSGARLSSARAASPISSP